MVNTLSAVPVGASGIENGGLVWLAMSCADERHGYAARSCTDFGRDNELRLR